MRRGRRGGASPARTSPVPELGEGLDLECLVRLVFALGGERGPALLAGLADPLRVRALRLLRGVRRGSRGERRAALALAFTGSRPDPGALAAVPGLLGACLRSELGLAVPEYLDRWARRLRTELAERA